MLPPPLQEKEIKKILVLSELKFQELQNGFRLFFKDVRDRLIERSSLLEANKGRIFRAKSSPEAWATKFSLANNSTSFRDYEPTNAIYCNHSERRRWIRVKEWFNQYELEDEHQKFQKEILIQ